MIRELPQKSLIIVAADGSGDYRTIGEAIAAVPDGNHGEVLIRLKPGIYEEKLVIPADKTHVSLIGEDAETTVIRYRDYAGKPWVNGDITGTFRSASVTVRANYFHAGNVTFENGYDGVKGSGGRQALALSVSGEHDSFVRCRFLGRQDTLYTKEGSQYFEECYIEGDTDFIFGGARAVFDRCQIHSIWKEEEPGKNPKGYVCAPSTPASQRYGYLFVNCRLTGDVPENSVFLGRPWHPGADPDSNGAAVFINCELGAHISERGWTDMGGFLAKNSRFYEYENTGKGSVCQEKVVQRAGVDTGNESAGSPVILRRQFRKEQAEEYTRERVLGWNPDTERGGCSTK